MVLDRLIIAQLMGFSAILGFDSWTVVIDNAKTETFFGHMKDELDISNCETFEEIVRKVDAFMYYYNNMRHMWSKHKMTPVQYRSHLVSSVVC